MSINFPSTPTTNQTYSFANTTWKWDGVAWTVVSSTDIVDITGFGTIEVAGQDNISATTSQDVLTVIEGNNVTIETNAIDKSITITAAGGGTQSNSFETIAVAGQSNVVAESNADTLTLVAGTNIVITTNAGSDTITISSTTPAGATTFSALTDAISAALTVNRFYMPAITALNVSNNGASAYRFDQYGSTDNPTIYAINGTTIAFNLNVTGHPFQIQTGPGVNYNTGLYHVDSNGIVSTGSAAQGKTSGTLYWKIPTDIAGGYRYQCGVHFSMVGSISIKNFSTL